MRIEKNFVDRIKSQTKLINRKTAFCFLLFAFCFSCSFSTKQEAGEAGWTVTVSGKVGFPDRKSVV